MHADGHTRRTPRRANSDVCESCATGEHQPIRWTEGVPMKPRRAAPKSCDSEGRELRVTVPQNLFVSLPHDRIRAAERKLANRKSARPASQQPAWCCHGDLEQRRSLIERPFHDCLSSWRRAGSIPHRR